MEGIGNNNAGLLITDIMKKKLLSAVKWLRFMAIVGAVSMGVLVIAGVGMLFLPTGESIAVGLVYIVMALVYIYPLKKMFDIAAAARIAMTDDDQQEMEDAVNSTYALMKFIGVLTCIALGLYAVAIVGVIVAGVGTALF